MTGRTGSRTVALALLLLMIPILFPVVFLSIVAGFGAKSPSQTGCPPSGAAATNVGIETVGDTKLDAEQLQVAGQIVAAVRRFGPTVDKPRAAVIALATARQESGIRNLDYGDRDSLGPFQQRPSQGWGTPAQVRDVPYATVSFLERLVRIPGWETMRVTDAAATVQRPAEQYRGLYEQWVPLATALTERLWGTALTSVALHDSPSAGLFPDSCSNPGQDSVPANCSARGGAAEAGLTQDALRVMRCVLTVFGPHVVGGLGDRSNASAHPSGRAVDIMIASWDTPAGNAEGWEIAHWVEANATQLGVTYVIFDAKIWSPARDDEAWRTYSHPTGASSPTLDHLDHVHVSVAGDAGYDTPLPGTTPNGPGGPDAPDPPGTGRVTVGSFNVLGHHHSEPGGKNSRLDSGPSRMARALDKIEGLGISIVGLQELETPQAHTILQRGWELHRARPNNTFRDGNTMGNAIAWNPTVWTLVDTDELRVAYRDRTLHMPIARLRHSAGVTLTVLSIHNPPGRSEAAWRARARAAENDAIASFSGPVVITGDFNERTPSLCAASRSASGGTGCRPKPWGGLDFIFTAGGATPREWNVDRSTRGNESDVHPIVYATLN